MMQVRHRTLVVMLALAVVIGVAVNARAGATMAALKKGLATQGGAPTAGQAAQLATLQARVERGGQAAAVLLLIAAGAMAVARYL